MPLSEILERNRAFLQGRKPEPLPPPEAVSQLILACYDLRLDTLLHGALGLDLGNEFLVRSAGAAVSPAGDPLRSIALAVYLFDVKGIAVVGHTSCRMATFDTTRFIEAFRRRGVPRDGFGHDDLRVWAGAIADPKRGVQASVGVLRAAPCLPRDLEICGLVLDDTTGALEVVVKPDEAVPGVAGGPGLPAEAEPEHAEREAEAQPSRGEPEQKSAAAPAASAAKAQAPAGAPDLNRLLAAARTLVQTAEAQAVWRYEVRRLRAELHAEPNPITRVRLIHGFVQKAIADSREVAAALDRLKREAQGAHVQLDEAQLMELVRRALMGEP
jgi:carbonic anhydrase